MVGPGVFRLVVLCILGQVIIRNCWSDFFSLDWFLLGTTAQNCPFLERSVLILAGHSLVFRGRP